MMSPAIVFGYLFQFNCLQIDSQLLFWCAVALLTAQRWWSRLNEHTLAVDEWFEERGVTYTDSNYGEAKVSGDRCRANGC